MKAPLESRGSRNHVHAHSHESQLQEVPPRFWLLNPPRWLLNPPRFPLNPPRSPLNPPRFPLNPRSPVHLRQSYPASIRGGGPGAMLHSHEPHSPL
eukprot:3912769-Rhodomonas_salina.1